MSEDQIRSARFRSERDEAWKRLETLVTTVEKEGHASLSYTEVEELTLLYRQAVSGLSVARDVSLDRALIGYLEALVARAYFAVYAPRAALFGVASRFFGHSGPAALVRQWRVILFATAVFFAGALVAFLLYQQDSSWFYSFVDGGLAGGRTPEASAEYLREAIYDNEDAEFDNFFVFAAFLLANNATVAVMAFGLGVIACLPGMLALFYNGLVLGAFFALYYDKGMGLDLFGWLSIHGVTELSAIFIAGAAGILIGSAWLFPGKIRRVDAVRAASRDAIKLVVVSAIMLVAAAILEGFARQMITSLELRLFIGWGIGALWVTWAIWGARNTP